MNDLLPIKSLRDEDISVVGNQLLFLAKLAQLDFPVAEGVVINPPKLSFKALLKNYNFSDRERFESALELLKDQIFEIKAPSELKALISNQLRVNQIWKLLLEKWFLELSGKLWNGDFTNSLSLELSAQPIFFTDEVISSVKAYPKGSQIFIEKKGNIDESLDEDIKKVVKDATKKLFLPYIYSFILTKKGLELVGILPYTPREEEPWIFTDEKSEVTVKQSFSLKLFLLLSDSFEIIPGVDGVIVDAKSSGDFDNKVLKLIEASNALPDKEVIYKLSDLVEYKAGVRGALRLIHQPKLLEEDSSVVLYARNKKGARNVSVAIPFVRSVNEFLQIKRDLASKGLSRKGSMKLWIEVCVPENIINIEEYISAGLDGVVLNLDELSDFLGGIDSSVAESIFYSRGTGALMEFLTQGIKALHKNKIPIIATGRIVFQDEILKFLVLHGVWGVVADLADAKSMGDHLNFVEERLIRSQGETAL